MPQNLRATLADGPKEVVLCLGLYQYHQPRSASRMITAISSTADTLSDCLVGPCMSVRPRCVQHSANMASRQLRLQDA